MLATTPVPPPKRAVLLDFDGVVLKKSPGHRIIAKRCESFVNKFVRLNDRESVENLNKHLYRTSGHTLLGLRKLGYDISIEEFNNHVYTPEICNKVVPSAADKAELQEFCDEYVKRVRGVGGGVGFGECGLYISSNAPDLWCKTILEKMDVDVDLFQMAGSSDVECLKPQPEYYAGVHEKIKADHYAFVDDSRINLMPLVDSSPMWSPYLYNMYAGSCAGGRITYNVLHTINYLPNLLDVIF
jgi:FMN phosphatase YigB (HAD superfamily)